MVILEMFLQIISLSHKYDYLGEYFDGEQKTSPSQMAWWKQKAISYSEIQQMDYSG